MYYFVMEGFDTLCCVLLRYAAFDQLLLAFNSLCRVGTTFAGF